MLLSASFYLCRELWFLQYNLILSSCWKLFGKEALMTEELQQQQQKQQVLFAGLEKHIASQ